MVNTLKVGPSGLGGISEAVSNLEYYKSLGISACEIAFTYGAYIKTKKQAEPIKQAAEKLKISLSIHAPYWINLNSEDKEKIEQSKKRILRSLEVGTWLGATHIVFHAGYYGKLSKPETYENIKKQILEIQEEIKKNKYTPKLAPEVMGKINVFGSIEEISKLSKETKTGACIDVAHILARYKENKFSETWKAFNHLKEFHIHFSGIEYTEKGEKNHKRPTEKEITNLLKNLPKNKPITIISESPSPVEDTILTLDKYTKL